MIYGLKKSRTLYFPEIIITSNYMTGGGLNQSARSNYSDEKFHSSFTEDELKHDFRQVLPSENHRRKSMDHHRDLMVSAAEETSSVRYFSLLLMRITLFLSAKNSIIIFHFNFS